jgi:hypothetical protein
MGFPAWQLCDELRHAQPTQLRFGMAGI